VPSQDIVLGIYYLTRERPLCKGEGKSFSSPEEVRIAYDAGELDLHAAIKVRINGVLENTTTGRVLLYEIFPEKLPFSMINKVMNKKELRSLINESYRRKESNDRDPLGPAEGHRLPIRHSVRHLHLHERHDHSFRKVKSSIRRTGK
jgi:DNA-directed RNA polymerase beta' subunit